MPGMGRLTRFRARLFAASGNMNNAVNPRLFHGRNQYVQAPENIFDDSLIGIAKKLLTKHPFYDIFEIRA